MANFVYTVRDATTNELLGGCEVVDVINTTPCPTNLPLGLGGNQGNCTSGPGWTSVADTGPTTGTYTAPTVYTCPMSHSVTVSAPGYQSTTIDAETGDIDGDAAVPEGGIFLTPLRNVGQGNQGAGSAALSATNEAQDATSNLLSDTWLWVGLAVVAVVFVIIFLTLG